jgi:hypothetical protein
MLEVEVEQRDGLVGAKSWRSSKLLSTLLFRLRVHIQMTAPYYFRFSFADRKTKRIIWGLTIMQHLYLMIPMLSAFDNGELWNLKGMSGMQAEKEESTLFSNFK